MSVIERVRCWLAGETQSKARAPKLDRQKVEHKRLDELLAEIKDMQKRRNEGRPQ